MPREIPVEGRLVLSGAITLQSADSIHSRLLEMAAQPVVEIDCSGVTEANLSLIQLILAARASAHRSGRTVLLAQPAAGALRETLRRGGFLGETADQHSPDQAFWTQAAEM
jgi:anti-anti-sigma regulatory factor